MAAPTFAAVGSHPTSVVIADFTGDGIPDIATANQLSSNYSLLEPSPDAGFETRFMLLPFAPAVVRVADFNHDDRPDLVFAGNGEGQILVLLNAGQATFANYAVSTGSSLAQPSDVAVGDFDGDGIPDLAAMNGSTAPSTVLLSDGGMFTLLIDLPGGGGSTTPNPTPAICAADFAGRGVVDVITATYADGLLQLINLDRGHTWRPVALPVPNLGLWLVAAPTSTNGRVDVLYPGECSVNVLHALPDAGFGAPRVIAAGGEPFFAATADLDGDGYLDIVAAVPSSNTVNVMLGRADGGYDGPWTFDVGVEVLSLTVGDLNGDGRPDIVATTADDRIAVLLGK